MDANLILQIGTLAAIIITAVIAWYREGRAHDWAVAEAAILAKELREKNEALAVKVAADAAAVLAKGNADAATLAKDLIADALKVSEKVSLAAEKLANSVKESTEVSTDAVRGAQHAFTEANSQNNKIVTLNTQVLEIMQHIKDAGVKSREAERKVHEEALFNTKVKAEIEKTLKEMNGRIPPVKNRKQGK